MGGKRFYQIVISLFISMNFSFPLRSEINCELSTDRCNYYLCHELKKTCGNSGYSIDFGYRYCLKYQKDEKYTSQGKDWLAVVRECLQSELNALSDDLSCKETRSQAVKSHYGCYIDAGFCSLPLSDQRRIIRTAGFKLLDPEVFLSGLQIIKTCYQSGEMIW